MSAKPTGLHCPGCGKRVFRTVNSRPAHGGQRRRRECVSCGFRVTTMETITRTTQPGPARPRAEGAAE